MKGLHYLGYICVAVFVLSACGWGGPQSQGASSSPSGQDPAQTSIHPLTSKKHIGQYWWIWLSVKIQAGKRKTLLVYCPQKYVVTGGGFSERGSVPPYTYTSEPLVPTLNGWEVVAGDSSCPPSGCNWSGVEIAYAVCAPIT